ncbi:SusC/RagA family TonB-linked outer membrane protein [Sphingobacterium sp. UT-1RO-CII-1]|uniref:SusC/RagA family TonB-linked outer membrane protein n=1 Tax=Sphingobacterium sp. UT-1RO-CII-1 TaxID=2995225 RepID=UPI00227D2A97|nr:SusC/RagA family TonB-linked outer membrane protein [Sphingobacterium sp. UT-1RO-CII-1]MCY4780021.1 SusC/RagA family TonB-linked outer membrane protein [Sphingobacterium sp. UT-1RO-CII-1]
MKNLIRLYLCYLVWLPIAVTANQTQDSLIGKVLNRDNEQPLSGASIRILGSPAAVQTDVLGAFTLIISDSEELYLIASHIGFQNDTIYWGGLRDTELIFKLTPQENTIEEVLVSTGYSQLSQKHQTGSFETIDQKLFNRQFSTDILSRLDGVANSLMFDRRNTSMSSIQIRGLTTLTGAIAQPLIILDNFPYEGDINNINPNDIDQVTILKDAAAASIWGARAGNGVIVMTTKKGRFEANRSISMNGNIGFTQRPNLFYTPQMKSSDFIDIEKFLFNEGEYDFLLGNRTSWPVITPVVEILQKEKNGIYTTEQASNMIDKLREIDVRKDLYNYFYRNAMSRQYSIGLSGGTQNTNYSLSGGYDRNLSNAVGDSYERISFRSANTYRLMKNLTLDASLMYTHSKNVANNPGPIYTSDLAGPLYPYADLVDNNGNALVLERNYRNVFIDSIVSDKLLDWRYRPYDEIDIADNSLRVEDMVFNFGTNYKFLNLFEAQIKYQFHTALQKGRNHQSLDSWYTRNIINRFSQIDGDVVKYRVPLGGILDETHSNRNGHSVRGQLNFTFDKEREHSIRTFLGAEIRRSTLSYRQDRTYGYDDDYLAYSTVDPTNRYPIYEGLSADAYIPYGAGFRANEDRAVSLYINGSYAFLERYILTASARRDATNLFGTTTNNKWKPLWSVGGAWEISREPFYKLTALSLLKLRLTHGYTGNVNNSVSALTTLAFFPMSGVTQLPYAYIDSPPNPSLRWEQVRTWNVGVDFSSKKNRIRGILEYYNKSSTDVITAEAADPTTGYLRFKRNSASLQNRGIDIILTTVNLMGALGWQSDFMMSKNRLIVDRYLGEQLKPSSMVGNGATILPIQGQGAYNIVSYRWAGLDPENGNPLGYVAGEISDNYRDIIDNATIDDLVFHGSPTPEYFGALRNTLSYKQLSLSINITYRTNYHFRRNSVLYRGIYGGEVGHGDYYKRWQKPGDERQTYIPSAKYPVDNRRDQFYRDAEVLVESGDHIRLQDINVSYRIQPVNSKRLWLKSLTVTGYLSNVALLWVGNSINVDPDYPTGPAPLRITFGLKADL